MQVRYDDELQAYLKSQGLRSLKQKAKKKPEPKPAAAPAAAAPAVRRETASAAVAAQPPPAHSTPAATQQQQLAQAFMGLPIAGMGGGLPMAVGMPPGMMGMLPHFSQVIKQYTFVIAFEWWLFLIVGIWISFDIVIL